MFQDAEVAFLPAPDAEAPPRKVGRLARGALVSLGMVACVALGLCGTTTHEDRVAKARNFLALSGWTFGFRKYEQVQYFGLNLFTAPGRSIDGCFGSHEDASKCRLGSPGVTEDIEQRANILLKAIHAAHAADHVDHANKTLKIFLAPEWYWTGLQGAYLLDGDFATDDHTIVKKVMTELLGELAQPRFEHWIFVLGTFVFGERRAEDAANSLGGTHPISYYNFAPIHVGGTDKSYAGFKDYITKVDWRQGFVDGPQQEGAMAYCEENRKARGCLFGRPAFEVMDSLGFGHLMPLQGNRFDVGGIAVGFEVDHDHKYGVLDRSLDISQTVDVHLIVSQGMTIAMGPVCTRTGGPVFLADGSARTEMSLNPYGIGRTGVVMPNGKLRYGLGVAYGADSLVAFQQWLGDILVTYTGQDWGPRAPGEGTLPGGSTVDGDTGIPFNRISAFGEHWHQIVDGYYRTGSYDKAQKVYADFRARLESEGNTAWIKGIEVPKIAPTIDIYGPVMMVDTDQLN